jgi:hypothetical protein
LRTSPAAAERWGADGFSSPARIAAIQVDAKRRCCHEQDDADAGLNTSGNDLDLDVVARRYPCAFTRARKVTAQVAHAFETQPTLRSSHALPARSATAFRDCSRVARLSPAVPVT